MRSLAGRGRFRGPSLDSISHIPPSGIASSSLEWMYSILGESRRGCCAGIQSRRAMKSPRSCKSLVWCQDFSNALGSHFVPLAPAIPSLSSYPFHRTQTSHPFRDASETLCRLGLDSSDTTTVLTSAWSGLLQSPNQHSHAISQEQEQETASKRFRLPEPLCACGHVPLSSTPPSAAQTPSFDRNPHPAALAIMLPSKPRPGCLLGCRNPARSLVPRSLGAENRHLTLDRGPCQWSICLTSSGRRQDMSRRNARDILGFTSFDLPSLAIVPITTGGTQ